MCRPSNKVCNHKIDYMIMCFSGILSSAAKDSSSIKSSDIIITYDRDFQWKIRQFRELCKVSN